MAEEAVTIETVETKSEPELTIEVAPDDFGSKGKPPELSDEEVAKLSEAPPEDEIGRYAQQAQKRIKSLQIANQELRRRANVSQKDVATATTLAEQLYRENLSLKQNVSRSDAALIDQALQRAEAQLAQAQNHFQAAWATQDPSKIAAANVEVAQRAAEIDRLRLLKQPAEKDPDGPPGAAPAAAAPSGAPPQQNDGTPATQAWIAKNPWFKTDPEFYKYAIEVHKALASQGITEMDGDEYWGTLDKRVRKKFPERYAGQPANGQPSNGQPANEEPPPARESGGRPVTVTGATRVNGAAEAKRAPRHVTLSESQVRIATALGLTLEQYATQLLKEEAMNAKERVQ